MEIVIILILIFTNGIFALSEIAFVSARREILDNYLSRGSRCLCPVRYCPGANFFGAGGKKADQAKQLVTGLYKPVESAFRKAEF